MHDTRERFQPRARWGQNFLVNQGAADTIVIAFRPLPSDLVLEVGPGRGALTRRLASRVGRLVAVEIDPDLAAALRVEFGASPSVEIVGADILDLDLRTMLERLGATTALRARVIANLSYAIATAVILRLIEQRTHLADVLVLVQREVAERLVSPPGRKAYGGLSVLCQAHARVEKLLRLKPGSFRPIPKVESELVRLTLRAPDEEAPRLPAAVPGALEALLRAAFAQRRKTLLNNLARLPGPRGVPIGPETARALIQSTGLDPGTRPERVPVDGFLALLRAHQAL